MQQWQLLYRVTKNIDRRVLLHQNGRGARYTKTHKPQKVVYIETFDDRAAAMRRERAIKKLNHSQKQSLVNSQKNNSDYYKILKHKEATETKAKSKKKSSWTEKLNNSHDLPKVMPISRKMSTRWGVGTIVIPAPLEVDEYMRSVPLGKLTTVKDIRIALAIKHDATIGCPLTTGIFVRMAANAAAEQQQNGKAVITPFWRTLKADGFLNDKYPGGIEFQKQMLEGEGHAIASKGKRLFVVDYTKALTTL